MLSGKEWPTGIWSSLVNLPFGFLDQSELAPLSRPSSGGRAFFCTFAKADNFPITFSRFSRFPDVAPFPPLVRCVKGVPPKTNTLHVNGAAEPEWLQHFVQREVLAHKICDDGCLWPRSSQMKIWQFSFKHSGSYFCSGAVV